MQQRVSVADPVATFAMQAGMLPRRPYLEMISSRRYGSTYQFQGFEKSAENCRHGRHRYC
jgi:hypothetical protein